MNLVSATISFIPKVSDDLLDLQASQNSCFIKNKRDSDKVEIDGNNNRNNINNKEIII